MGLPEELANGLGLLARRDDTDPAWKTAFRSAFVDRIPEAFAPLAPDLSVRGSAGYGALAAVPWVGAFPPGSDPTSGIYLAHLFAADGTRVYLSLCQASQGAFREGLAERAATLRKVIGPVRGAIQTIDLASANPRPRSYENATALAYEYLPKDLAEGGRVEPELATMRSALDKVRSAGAIAVGAVNVFTGKEAIAYEIERELGVPHMKFGPGSKEPKQLLYAINDALDLKFPRYLTKPALAKAIVERMGLAWDAGMESTGSTVTAAGLTALLRGRSNAKRSARRS